MNKERIPNRIIVMILAVKYMDLERYRIGGIGSVGSQFKISNRRQISDRNGMTRAVRNVQAWNVFSRGPQPWRGNRCLRVKYLLMSHIEKIE